MIDIIVAGGELKQQYKTYGHSGHIFRARSRQNSNAPRNASSHIATHKPKQRVTRAAHKQASMKAQPQNARSRYLTTISTMEKLSPASLECSNLETKFLWLLNAGDMAARARSGITIPQNLPGTPVQVVELLAKVSRV
jgi:hypothetical protein